MLILIAKFRLKPEYIEEFINISEGMLEPSRSEDGCIHYELLQNPYNPTLFTFYEKWRNQEALEEHFQEEYFGEFVNSISELIEGEGDVMTYEVSSEQEIK